MKKEEEHAQEEKLLICDELQGIDGMECVDERFVREQVAADIAVQSSSIVARETDKFTALLKKLRETEGAQEAAMQQQQQQQQQQQHASRVTGSAPALPLPLPLPPPPPPAAAAASSAASSAASAAGFEARRLAREVERLSEQIDVQRRIVEKAKAEERGRALLHGRQERRSADDAAESARRADAAMAGARAVTSPGELQLGASLRRGPGASAAPSSVVGGAVGPGARGGGSASGAAAAVVIPTFRQRASAGGPSVDPRHVRGPNATTTAAVDDYRGGEVLTSVNSVTVKSLGKGLTTRRTDDGDASLFAARLEKDKRRRREAPRSGGGGDHPQEAVSGDAARAGYESGDGGRSDAGDEDADEPPLLSVVPGWFIDAPVYEALLPYQQSGVRWLVGLAARRVGGILGDEMGLGKTVQIAAFLNAALNSKMLLGPVLIVAPLTVLYQWVAELHKWCPKLRAVVFHSSGSATSSRRHLIEEIRDCPAVVITTYAAVTQQNALLQSGRFQFIILDEGHKISNPDAHVTVACKAFTTPHRIVLTGSPIQNTLKELWCLFDFVHPGLLGNQQKFVEEFEVPIAASKSPRASELQIETAVECAKLLRAHIAPYLLRRLKRDVNAMLPPKHERVVRCLLTDEQLEAYCEVLSSPEVQQYLAKASSAASLGMRLDRNFRAGGGGLVSGGNRTGISEGLTYQAFRVLSQLRMLCNHLDIWRLKRDDVAEGGSGSNISFRSNNLVSVAASAKLATLAKLLERWSQGGHKALIFSQTRMMLDIIENLVEQSNHRYIRMDGNTPTKHRSVLIDRFNEDDSIVVALLTTKVGGLGVNLTGADRVVIFDPDWNPVTDEQARERAWRIGQRREVCVYRMITAGTVEEYILHRQLAKTYVTDKVLKDPRLQRFFTTNQLSDAFFLGAVYADRVPPAARAFVISGAETSALVDEIDQEMLREEDEDNAIAATNGREEPRHADTRSAALPTPPLPSETVDGRRAAAASGSGSGGENSTTQTSLLSRLVDAPDGGEAAKGDRRRADNANMFYDIGRDSALIQRMASTNARSVMQRAITADDGTVIKRERM